MVDFSKMCRVDFLKDTFHTDLLSKFSVLLSTSSPSSPRG